jgi:hypothetical protein
MSVRRMIIGSALALTISTASARQDTHPANVVLPGCKSLIATAEARGSANGLADAYDVDFCAGMIHVIGLTIGSAACVPSNVTVKQVAQVIVRYVEARPQRMHEPVVRLAFEALHDAWPCRRKRARAQFAPAAHYLATSFESYMGESGTKPALHGRHQRLLKQFNLYGRRAGQGEHRLAGYPSLLLLVADHYAVPSRKIVFDDDAGFHLRPVLTPASCDWGWW